MNLKKLRTTAVALALFFAPIIGVAWNAERAFAFDDICCEQADCEGGMWMCAGFTIGEIHYTCYKGAPLSCD